MFTVMVGAGSVPETVLARLLPDSETLAPVDAQLAWTRAQLDPLIALWLSLYSGVAGEPRWDVKILRCCSLLEAIARERLPAESPVTDGAGKPLVGYGGAPATTGSLRGKLKLGRPDRRLELADEPIGREHLVQRLAEIPAGDAAKRVAAASAGAPRLTRPVTAAVRPWILAAMARMTAALDS